MKAFVVDNYKKKAPLRLADVPDPQVRANDVLVRIEATAINLLDSKVRDGEFKLFLPYRPPFILGHDLAGTVVRVGANVRQFKAGDEVYEPPNHALRAREDCGPTGSLDVGQHAGEADPQSHAVSQCYSWFCHGVPAACL